MTREDTDLLPELKKYLNDHATPPLSTPSESELVKALKHELSLAARAGQKLLMALKAAEEAKTTLESQVKNLARENAVLAAENRKLQADHEILSESLEMQDNELAILIKKLGEVSTRADKLARAAGSARSLEREIESIQQQQHTKQKPTAAELSIESKKMENMIMNAQKSSNHTQLLSPPTSASAENFDSFNNSDCLNMSEMPSLISDLSLSNQEDYTNTTANDCSLNLGVDTPSLLHDINVLPHNTATPVRQKPVRTAGPGPNVSVSPSSGLGPAPPLLRSHSHESVFTLAQTPAKLAAESDNTEQFIPTICQSKPIITAPTPSSVVQQHSKPRTSAREQLQQLSKSKEPRRWIFTPFRRQ